MNNRVLWSALLLALFTWKAGNSQHVNELPAGYYVVVAAYSPAKETAAKRYASILNDKGIKAAYGYNTRKRYYFVYLDYFTELKPSLRRMYQARKDPRFPDAWVRVVSGDIPPPAPTVSTPPPEPVTDTTPAVTEAQIPTPTGDIPVDTADRVTVSEEISDNPEIVQYDTMTLGNTEVFLSLFNATNNRIVEGTVKVVDYETKNPRLIKEVKGNDYMYLPDPKNKSGQLTLICEAFGYRKVQHEINYPLPLADTVKEHIDLMGTTFIVYFDLIRYHQGDKVTLYHVYFFNDAAIMLPESKFELVSLMEMMQENPNYRIKLHGHTNGNYHGRIILMGPEKNFFALDGSRNTVGSAKDLSRARAEVIRDYLIANGIKGDRIEIKSWGGKRPIYDRHSANARKNVRVEVEILQE